MNCCAALRHVSVLDRSEKVERKVLDEPDQSSRKKWLIRVIPIRPFGTLQMQRISQVSFLLHGNTYFIKQAGRVLLCSEFAPMSRLY